MNQKPIICNTGLYQTHVMSEDGCNCLYYIILNAFNHTCNKKDVFHRVHLEKHLYKALS